MECVEVIKAWNDLFYNLFIGKLQSWLQYYTELICVSSVSIGKLNESCSYKPSSVKKKNPSLVFENNY